MLHEHLKTSAVKKIRKGYHATATTSTTECKLWLSPLYLNYSWFFLFSNLHWYFFNFQAIRSSNISHITTSTWICTLNPTWCDFIKSSTIIFHDFPKLVRNQFQTAIYCDNYWIKLMMFQTFQTELILEPNHFLSWFGRPTGRPIWINLCSCSLVHETLKKGHPNAKSEGENHRYKDAKYWWARSAILYLETRSWSVIRYDSDYDWLHK